MNKRKKQIYGVVIAVVAVALVLEQMTGAGGSTPAAAAGALAVVPRPPARRHAGRARTGDLASAFVLVPARFPSNLSPETSGKRARRRDLFGLSDEVKRALGDPDARGGGAAEPGRLFDALRDAVLSPGAAFAERHTVSAVVSSGEFATVFVDGTWLGIGQRIDGCALVRITGHTAVFECASQEVELSVDTGEPSLGPRALRDGDD